MNSWDQDIIAMKLNFGSDLWSPVAGFFPIGTYYLHKREKTKNIKFLHTKCMI